MEKKAIIQCIPPVYGLENGYYLKYPRMGIDPHASRISTPYNQPFVRDNHK